MSRFRARDFAIDFVVWNILGSRGFELRNGETSCPVITSRVAEEVAWLKRKKKREFPRSPSTINIVTRVGWNLKERERERERGATRPREKEKKRERYRWKLLTPEPETREEKERKKEERRKKLQFPGGKQAGVNSRRISMVRWRGTGRLVPGGWDYENSLTS